MDYDRLKQMASLKFQLRVSAVILLFYLATYLVFTENEGTGIALLTGIADQSSATASKQEELTWEILVVDPNLREELWKRYRAAPDGERRKALFAILIMMESISDEQAQKLAEGVIRFDGETTSHSHREQMHKALEKLAVKTRTTLPVIAVYSIQQLRESDNYYKVEEVRRMMKRIENTIQESPYLYCLEKSSNAFQECAKEMVRERDQVHRDALWRLGAEFRPDSQRYADVLVVLAGARDPRPKAEISRLLESRSQVHLRLALELIREYAMTEYLPRLQQLRASTQLENVREDLDATIRYLQLPNR